MRPEYRKKTPEELLSEVQAEEARAGKGRLKIFLGYASGVGKSYRMLDEARRRRARGQDVIVGAVQHSVPADVQALLATLEAIPLRDGNAIDLDAILRRHPSVCFIDGLAYDNPPGSRHATRWQDARELLDAGISVVASINIQYISELSEQVESLTGKHVETTVPLTFVESADEIVIVDVPPEEAYGRTDDLSRLREMALVVAADVVDQQLNTYLHEHGIDQRFGAQERILVCITPRANIEDMLETATIITHRFHGEMFAAYVNQPEISAADQEALDRKLEAARSAGATVEFLEGVDPIATLLEFARARGITQLFIGHTQRSGIWSRLWGSPVDKLIRSSEGMDIRVFPQ
jgi:two-component system, OmpR family, sensor histidine kinase KdpD